MPQILVSERFFFQIADDSEHYAIWSASFIRRNFTIRQWKKKPWRWWPLFARSLCTSELRQSPFTLITIRLATSTACGTTTPNCPNGLWNCKSIPWLSFIAREEVTFSRISSAVPQLEAVLWWRGLPHHGATFHTGIVHHQELAMRTFTPLGLSSHLPSSCANALCISSHQIHERSRSSISSHLQLVIPRRTPLSQEIMLPWMLPPIFSIFSFVAVQYTHLRNVLLISVLWELSVRRRHPSNFIFEHLRMFSWVPRRTVAIWPPSPTIKVFRRYWQP